ncbi:MAG: hypothetical protein QOG57_693, partial [Pseudonocardiales bacterium]|nr:hypothetical protein [Pseudonocardiales bacterium]
MTRSPRTTRSARVATGALAALLIGMTVLPGAAAAPAPRAAASSEPAKSDPVTLAALFDNNNGDGDPFGGSNFGDPGPPTITMAEIRAARAAEQAARRAA